MNFKFYRDILSQEQEYRVGQVRYIVESHFCPFPDPEQKIHPPNPMVPSLFGQVKPPSREIL